MDKRYLSLLESLSSLLQPFSKCHCIIRLWLCSKTQTRLYQIKCFCMFSKTLNEEIQKQIKRSRCQLTDHRKQAIVLHVYWCRCISSRSIGIWKWKKIPNNICTLIKICILFKQALSINERQHISTLASFIYHCRIN